MKKLLRIDASMRIEGSHSRQLLDRVVEQLSSVDVQVQVRDLAKGVPFVSQDWIYANFTPPEERGAEQRRALEESDALIAELESAELLVIGLPIYNFGPPAAFKAWVDMITRARKTFRYAENGPEGLLTGKRAVVVVTSGGTELGSEIDFVSQWVKHVLGFIGITDLEIIDASGLMKDEAAVLARAQSSIDELSETHLAGAE